MVAKRRLISVSAVCAVFLIAWLVARWYGAWLTAADPPGRADAIVVLGGDMPYRASEAASMYKADYAPEVWLMPADLHDQDRVMSEMGLEVTPEYVYNARVLERLGVPRAAIRILGGGVHTTRDEVDRIRTEMEQRGLSNVMLVTSPYHIRRVKVTWNRLVGERKRALVCRVRHETFDATGWWRRPSEALAAMREFVSIINTWAGFPLHGKRS